MLSDLTHLAAESIVLQVFSLPLAVLAVVGLACQEIIISRTNSYLISNTAFSGLSESTVQGKQNEYTEFSEAIKKGRAEGLNQVSNALLEKATQGNVTAMIYYLKIRDRENWGENQPEPLREIPPMQIVVDGRALANQSAQ